MKRFFCGILAMLAVITAFLVATPSRAFQDMDMDMFLTVDNGQIVVHWHATGFDHYNIRWSVDGGRVTQVEREGDKDFRFLTAFRPGAIYKIAVQGCEKSFASSSKCTGWSELQCGAARNPCAGPLPEHVVSGGGLCLDVNAPDQRKNGGRVQVWACNAFDQQLWTPSDRGGIISLAGKCLDVNLPDLRKNGGRVQVWDCNGSIQQKWIWRGQQLRSQGGKCLDVDLPALRKNGGTVQVWDCNGSVQQSWSQPKRI